MPPYTAFTTAFTFLDHLASPRHEPEHRSVPSTVLAEPVPSLPPAGSVTLQPADHASQSVTHFPQLPGCNGFISARVLDGGRTLALRWLSLIQGGAGPDAVENGGGACVGGMEGPYAQLDELGCMPPVHFHFADPIVHAPHLSTSLATAELVVNVLTARDTIYRLTFPAPALFYTPEHELPEDWCVDHEVGRLAGKTALLVHGVDGNVLLIATSEGGMGMLRWGRLVGLHAGAGWTYTDLSLRTGWWPLLFSSSAAASIKSHGSSGDLDARAAPEASVAMASTVGDSGSAEHGWAFSVGRDRKLRTWNLATYSCSSTLELAKPGPKGNELALAPTESDGSLGGNPATAAAAAAPMLLPAAPRVLLRYSPAMEGDDPAFEGYLVAYVPSALAPAFVTYGVAATKDRRNLDLVLLEERPCADLGPPGRPRGDLRDFQIAALDPAARPPHGGLVLWTVWGEGGATVLRYSPLIETRTWSRLDQPAWVEAGPAAGEPSWEDPAFFDDLLADAGPQRGVAEVFAEHVLGAGRYPPSTLEYAARTYEKPLLHDRSDGRSAAVDRPHGSLEERVASVVGSTVQLEESPQTGAPLYDHFDKQLKLEWLKFAAMCGESRGSALWPLELAVDADRGLALVMGRNSIIAPVLMESAAVLGQMVRSGQLPKDTETMAPTYPLLAEERLRDLAIVAASARALASEALARDALNRVEADLVRLARSPVGTGYAELIAELLDGEGFREEAAAAQEGGRLDVLRDVEDLAGGLHSLWELLTTAEVVAAPAQGSPEVQAQMSILGTSLVAHAAVQAIEARYAMARDALILLLYIRAFEESEGETYLPQLLNLFSALLATFESLCALRWTARQTATGDAWAWAGAGAGAADADDASLTDQMLSLHMTSAAHHPAPPLPQYPLGRSLITALLSRAYAVPYAGAHPAAAALVHGVAAFLAATQLLTPKMMKETAEGAVRFADALHRMGLAGLALEAAALFQPIAGLQYVRARACLHARRVEEAEDAFLSVAAAIYSNTARLDDDSGLAPVLPLDASGSLAAYYRHAALLFEDADCHFPVARFCELALAALDRDDAVGATGGVAPGELWARLFHSYMALGQFEDAFKALMAMTGKDLQRTSLRQLVQTMCEVGEVDQLLRFPWSHQETQLKEALTWRARHADIRAQPNYFMILYAYHTARGDYRSAAMHAYQLAYKLASLPHHPSAAAEVWTQQCYALLSAINALALVPDQHAWIVLAHAEPMADREGQGQGEGGPVVRKGRRVAYHIPLAELSGGPRDAGVVTLDDLRGEYARVLSRLELLDDAPRRLRAAGAPDLDLDLDPDVAVHLFLAKNRVDEAIAKAVLLGVDLSTLFRTLAERCARLARGDGAARGAHHPSASASASASISAADADVEWVNVSRDAATWEGSLPARAWRLLRLHLARHDGPGTQWRYHEAVLHALLRADRSVKLPPWLVAHFLERRPEVLVKALYRVELFRDAMAVAESAISNSNTNLPAKLNGLSPASAGAGRLPLFALEQLLSLEANDLDGDGDGDGGDLRARQQSLRDALATRCGQLREMDERLARQTAEGREWLG